MKIILLETLSNLGSVGDVVDVSPGYARNFLLPMEKAVPANARNVKHIQHQKLIVEHKLTRVREASEELKKKVEKQGVTISRKAGEQEKLFGSVTTQDIEEALKKAGILVSRKGIELSEPIKKVGRYNVSVKLDGGIEAKIPVEVIAEAK